MHVAHAIWNLRHRVTRSYFKSSSSLLFWLAARSAAQVALVFALTQLLGPEGYGSFVAALAIATLFTPLAGLGFYGVIVRDGARTPSTLATQLSEALSLWFPAALVFGSLALGTAYMTLPSNLHVPALAALVFGEIVSSSLVELLGRTEQAQHRAQHYGAMTAGLIGARLFALGSYATITHPTINGWMAAYSIASLIYALVILVCVTRKLPFTLPRKFHWSLLCDGLPFLLATLSLRIQAEVNKPVLARLGLALAGNFNIAQRALDIASLPLLALQEVLWPRLYTESSPLRRAVLPTILLSSLAGTVGVALWYLAPLVPYLLGAPYNGVSSLIRMLALLPAIQVLRNMIGVITVATNLANTLVGSYIICMITAIAFNLWLVPAYGMHGAIAAAYASEITAIITLSIVLAYNLHRRRTSS
ncbi:oligosaccharide flippase family protein [Rhodanobacter lindaniclasticus]